MLPEPYKVFLRYFGRSDWSRVIGFDIKLIVRELVDEPCLSY
jgi:hypothetical protein